MWQHRSSSKSSREGRVFCWTTGIADIVLAGSLVAVLLAGGAVSFNVAGMSESRKGETEMWIPV